jgi:type I restriction enzyme M protein
MDQAAHNKIVSFLWGIADDVLRDLFKRGKYPDVILPMCVIRRMDAVLEPTKQAALDTKKMLDEARITESTSRALRCGGASFLQHVEVHTARSEIPRQPAAVAC